MLRVQTSGSCLPLLLSPTSPPFSMLHSHLPSSRASEDSTSFHLPKCLTLSLQQSPAFTTPPPCLPQQTTFLSQLVGYCNSHSHKTGYFHEHLFWTTYRCNFTLCVIIWLTSPEPDHMVSQIRALSSLRVKDTCIFTRCCLPDAQPSSRLDQHILHGCYEE